MNEQELLQRIADLPRDIPPRNDPWQKIEPRLEDRSTGVSKQPPVLRVRRWAPVAAAAAAVLAVALLVMPVGDPGPQVPGIATSETPATVPPPMMLSGSEAEYQAAFREFIATGESRETLPPLAVEKIETGWADLQRVESALSDALAQNPNDPFLNRRMLELRERQLGFLRQLAALDHSNRRLTI
jgi:negative regulator of sigma E activity